MKHPLYLGWAVVTLGALGVSNLSGIRLLPGTGAGLPRYTSYSSPSSSSSSSSSGSFFGGWRSYGSGGGSFHK